MQSFIPSPETDLLKLAVLINERTGLSYVNGRLDILKDRLSPLILEGHYQSVLDYYYFLKYDQQSGVEWLRIQTALAVNETYFWRENDQIEAAAEIIVPRLQKKHPDRAVRIWDAACATGEEPYTLAITLQEAGCYEKGPVEIFATDFNRAALDQARAAVYGRRSFRSIPPAIQAKYFTPIEREKHQLDPSIRNRVQFSYLNLVEAADQPVNEWDIIFCRNVFIYFSDDAIKRVLNTFFRVLKPDGCLFVAAAESLLRITRCFDLVEIGRAFGYQKLIADTMNCPRGILYD